MDGRARKRAEIIRMLERAGECRCDGRGRMSLHGGDGELVLEVTPDELVMVIQCLIDENRKLREVQRAQSPPGARSNHVSPTPSP